MIGQIHISGIEEFLAECFLDNNYVPFSVSISKEDDQGSLLIIITDKRVTNFASKEIDFELSPCECVEFDQMDISDYKNKTIHTSSAIELFEFLLMLNDTIECVVDFNGTAWKVMVL
jgi:hypothetical protein